MTKVYQALASAIQARLNCVKSANNEWYHKHTETIESIARDCLPSGSGIDSGCSVDLDQSSGDTIVIDLSFHHMDDDGSYDGWTEHTATIEPTFDGIDIRISGRNRNQIKEYLVETLEFALCAEYPR